MGGDCFAIANFLTAFCGALYVSESLPELIDLVDIGANLTHDSFDHDRDAMIRRAQLAGVGRMIVTGASCSM